MPNKLLKRLSIPLVVCLWFALWFLSQGQFMSNFWLLGHLGIADRHFLLVSAAVAFLMILLSLLVLNRLKLFGNILPKSKWAFLYTVIPIFIAAYLIRHSLSVSSVILCLVLMITVFWQDLLTFGFLQTYITKVSAKYGWLITALVFWFGHMVFYLDLLADHLVSWLLLLIASLLFAYATKKLKSFYLADVFHLGFILVI